MDLGATEQARRHLTRSIRLSQATGARISMARGLEAFAALAVRENRPERAVQLIAAATALREKAGLPPLAGARTESYLAPARRLGEAAVAQLWARGLAMSSEAAVALALVLPQPDQAPAGTGPALTASAAAGAGPALTASAAAGAGPALTVVPTLTAAEAYEVATAPPSSLTRRERQITALVARGRSNKAIAEELSISPTTAARHVANILAKLGFTSRTQIAAWVAGQQRGAFRPGVTNEPTSPARR